MDKSGVGSISNIINAIEWCMQNDIDIINMSFGTETYSKALEAEINSAYESGILLVAAAGNNGKGASDNIQYPAAYDNVIAVGAVDKENKVADFSSRGEALDLSAPGVEVYTTALGNSYGTVNGTSYAAPHVAAVAALLWQKDEKKSNEFIRQLLMESAQDLGEEKEYGNGLVDAEQAVSIYSEFDKNFIDGKVKDSWDAPETLHGEREYQGDEGFVAISGVILEEARSVDSDHNYSNGTTKTYTIKKNGANRIRVHFSRIDTESGHDFVTTSAGDNISGSYPDGCWSNYVTGNTITVTLTSDAATAGWGFAIDKISFEDDDLPTTPYMVLATGRTSSSISLKWNACTDSSGIITYDVYRRTTGGVSTKIGSTTTNTYNVTGITDNTLKYYVVARDSYGNTSEESKLVYASTAGITATPEFKVYKKDSSGNYVQLQSGDSIPIRSYVYVTCHTSFGNYMVLRHNETIVRRVMNPEAEDSQGGFSYQTIYLTSAGANEIKLEYGDNCDRSEATFLLNITSTASTITAPTQAPDAERFHFGEEGVNPGTGNYSYSQTDMDWLKPSLREGVVSRVYNSKDASNDSGLGTGWRLSFSSKITFTTGKATVTMPDGSIKPFTGTTTYTSDWTHDTLLKTNGTVTYGGKAIYYLLTLTDQTQYGYDSSGRMIVKVDKYGNVTKFDLDANGRVIKVTGPTGRYLTLTYDQATGLLSRIDDDTSRQVNYYYNEKSQLVYSAGVSGRPTYYAYDSNGKIRIVATSSETYGEETSKRYIATLTYTGDKVLTFKNEYGNTDTYTYGYGISNRTRVTRTDGAVSDYDYSTRYYLTRYMDELGAITTSNYNTYGDILQTTDRLGNSFTYVVDAKGNITSVTNPDGSKHYYAYDSKNNLICESDSDLAANPTTFTNTTWFLYDSNGIYLQKMAVQVKDDAVVYSAGANQDDYRITTWTYDTTSVIKGLVLTQSVRVNASKTNTTTYEYFDNGCLKTETDADGNKTSYNANDRGYVTKVVQPTGEYVLRSYDHEGMLLLEDSYDSNGASSGTTRNYVDLSGRTMFRVSGENYNPANDGRFYIDNNTSATPNSINTYYGTVDSEFITYSSENGNVLEKNTAENGEVSQTLYDTLGNVKEERASDGTITITTYDSLGRSIKAEYREAPGTAAKVISTTSFSTEVGFTLMNGKAINVEKVVTTTYLDGTEISGQSTEYIDYSGRTVKEHIEDSSSGTKKSSDMEYDYSPAGYLVKSRQIKDGNTISEEATYDAAGNVKSVKVPFDIINDTQYYSTKAYTYYGDGSLKEEKTSCNAPGSAEETRSTYYEYDGGENVILVKMTDGTKDNYTQYYYDEAGRMLRVYQGLSTRLTISGLDSVTSGADKEYSIIKYDYDTEGNLATKTDANGYVTTYISYDKDGNLTKSKDPNGNVSTYEYDNMGRLTYMETVATDVSKNCKQSYVYQDPVGGSSNSQVIITTVNGNDAPITTTRTNDPENYSAVELIQDAGETGTQGIKKSYIYNIDGSTKSFTVKINDVEKLSLAYEYTTQGELESVKEDGTEIVSYGYDVEGKLSTKTVGSINQAYSYNQQGAVNTAITTVNGNTVYNETIKRYVDGNVKTVQESVSERSQEFTYDKMGRLQTAVDNGLSTGYTGANYDSNGNTLRDLNGTMFVYDSLNRMSQATVNGVSTDYEYNADGLMSKRSNGSETTQYVWDGDQIVMELDADKNVVTNYIRGNGELLKAENGDGTLKWYYVSNSHGDIVKLLNNSYEMIKSYEYDEFGNEKNISSDDANPFRYCGEYYDKYSGTLYLRARSYSPGMGRFIQMDSYAGDYNNPLSLNLSTYCENDAINYVDLSGHWPDDPYWHRYFKPSARSVSEKGLNFIANMEVGREDLVLDSNGRILKIKPTVNNTTIGYGYDLTKDPLSTGIKTAKDISQAAALDYLRRVSNKYAIKIVDSKDISIKLNQQQLDALVALRYNIGALGEVPNLLSDINNKASFSIMKNHIYAYYENIVKKYPLNAKYLRGWKNRADTILNTYFYGKYGSMPIDAVKGVYK